MWTAKRRIQATTLCSVVLVALAMFGSSAGALTPVEVQKLVASDGAAYDGLGTSVAVSGNTAVIGAPWDGYGVGSAYVYVWNGSAWVLQQKLLAAETPSYASFGRSVAIDGDTVVIGAETDNAVASESGAVYVFTRSAGAWAQQAKLKASDPGVKDHFGGAVALDNGTILVGAREAEIGGLSNAGAAYVFTGGGSSWTQQAKLEGGVGSGYFGEAVALSGETAVIGAPYVNSRRGTAYVFTRSAGDWSQQGTLLASDGVEYDEFGGSVAVDGNTALIGAKLAATARGYAYVFTRTAGSWSLEAKLGAVDGADYSLFGYSVAVDGDMALIGAHSASGAAPKSGAAYIVTRSAGSWSQQAKLAASDGVDFDQFGYSVDLDNGTALIGADWDDDARGSAYIFSIPTTTDGTPPDISLVTVADVVYPADAIVTATATDAGSNIKSAEYKLENEAWTSMSATEAPFDAKSEGLTATIEGLTAGEYGVCVRATDTADNTSDGSDCDDFVVAAADMTITFGGVYIDMDSVPTTTLKATLSGPDACKIGATIEFYERIGTTWNKLGEDVTDEVGYADLSLYLTLGVHEIKVVVPDQYLDDGETPECTGDYDSGMTVVADANAASSGGGWYKVEYVAPPRVNFGYVANARYDKKTTQWVTSGNLLWINQNNFRLKGKIDQSALIECPSGAGYVQCAAFAGSGTLYEHNDAYNPTVDDPSLEWTGNSPLEVSFVTTVYDGGSSTVCQKKRCTVTERPDAIMMQINGASIPAAPYEAITLQGGGITVKK